MSERKFIQRELVIRNARLSFPAIFAPKTGPVGQDGKTGDPRYSATLILEPDNPSVAAILAAARAVAVEKWGDQADKMLAALKLQQGLCFGKGDEKLNREGNVPEELAGMIWVNVGRPQKKGPPLVVDRDPNVRLTEQSGRVYGGCFVNVKVQVWPLDMPGVQRRIVATMDTVQFVGDGDAFGGGRAPTAEGLEDLSQGEGAAPSDGSSLL